MKYYICLKNILIFSTLVICVLTTYDVKPPKANPYKEDKSVEHSLYREKDSPERMSVYPRSVPLPKDE